MYKITNECIEKELKELLEKAPFSYANLEKLNILCKAMWNLSKMHHSFTEEDAKEWVQSMNPPAKWTMEQTTSVMNFHGFHYDPCAFWVVMNVLYSDYGKTIAKHNLDKPEVWASLANDFLQDADAVPDKLARYWRDIVKH